MTEATEDHDPVTGIRRRPPAAKPSEAPTTTQAQAFEKKIKAAEARCERALLAMRGAHDAVKKSRAKTADALLAWQALHPPISREQLVRETIAKDRARMEANKQAGRHPTDDGNRKAPQFRTPVDAFAFHTQGKKGAGGGNSFRRLPSQR